MQSTTSSSGRSRPARASASAPAVVTPPAVSLHAHVLRQYPDSFDEIRVAHRDSPPAGLPHRARGEGPVRGIPDRERATDRVWHLGLDWARPALHQVYDRRASGRLRTIEPWEVAVHQPRFEKLTEPLPQLRNERA